MGVCVFVASGLDFDVDKYLKGDPFKTMVRFRKGDVPTKDNPGKVARPDSGFVVMVSQDDKPILLPQVMAALEFLNFHQSEFERMKAAGVDIMLLDFGTTSQHVLQTAHYLHPELIQAMSELQMGLIFSVVQVPTG